MKTPHHPLSHIILTAALFTTLALLPGCTGMREGKANVQSSVDAAQESALRLKEQSATRSAVAAELERQKQQDVNAPWLAGKSVPLAKEVTLPAVLRKRITALTPECNPSNYTINRLATCVTALTGQPVRVMPDALLPQSMFAMRSGGGAGAGAAAPSGGGAGKASDTLVVTPVNIKLSDLLDTAAAAWAIKYRVADDGAIELFRTETRILRLKALSQRVTHIDSQNTGFDANSKTSIENVPSDVIAGMRQSLQALGTNAGSVDINQASQSVIVNDTPEAIARIEAFLESENKRLTRRIKITVDQILVSQKQENQSSINWSALHKQLEGLVSVNSPASLATATAASLGFKPNANTAAEGSSLLLNALDERGLTATQRSFVRSGVTGNPILWGEPNLFDYVQSVSSNTVTGSSGTVSAPTITQKEDRFGTYMSITPEAQDDGQILLSISMTDRSGTLNPYTVQVSGAGTTIQQRNIRESTSIGRTIIRAGVPHLFSLSEEKQSASTGRRLDQDAPIILGGSDVATQSRRHTFLLITAVIEDNI
ncbi:MAG: hypothetical protein ORN29_09835 [Rhodoferax sp.]|nr:hypothetical protein [Rhodoferax sp.]